MKKVFQLSLLFFFGLTVYAQQPYEKGKQHQKFEARLKEFSTRLQLSKEQEVKVREIMLQSRTEAKLILDKEKSSETRKPKMKELANRTDQSILALLNDNQKVTYREIKKERKEKKKSQTDKEKEMRMEMEDAGIL